MAFANVDMLNGLIDWVLCQNYYPTTYLYALMVILQDDDNIRRKGVQILCELHKAKCLMARQEEVSCLMRLTMWLGFLGAARLKVTPCAIPR